jgi:hypothetical protein
MGSALALMSKVFVVCSTSGFFYFIFLFGLKVKFDLLQSIRKLFFSMLLFEDRCSET